MICPWRHKHTLFHRKVRFQDVQLTQNACIPLLQMEALRSQAVYAGQVLIAQEFEGVIHAFKQDGAIHLHLRNAAQVGVWRAAEAEAAPVVPRQGFVRLIQIVVELLVQVAHLQQLHVGKLQDRQDVLGISSQ
jgi:hypothetical protein